MVIDLISKKPNKSEPSIGNDKNKNEEIESKEEDNKNKKIFDIRERTLQFGIRIVKISMDIPTNAIFSTIRSQIIKSGTSIGANFAEGDGAKTKRDFVNKLVIARKEAKETKYWLRLLNELNVAKLKLDDDIDEVQQIINIISAIINKIEKSGSS